MLYYAYFIVIQEGLNFYIDERESYAEELETLINTRIFRSRVGRIGQWIFPCAIGDKNIVWTFNFKGNEVERIYEKS